jgi:hypothetical protein
VALVRPIERPKRDAFASITWPPLGPVGLINEEDPKLMRKTLNSAGSASITI